MIITLVAIVFGIWMLVGIVVNEYCRIWRAWWLSFDLAAIALWPVVLFFTFRNRPDL